MTDNPSTDPAMSHAAGRDEAADGLGELQPSIASGSPESADDVLADQGDGPAPAGGPGSDDADRTGPPAGTASGGEVSSPLG